MALVFKRGIWGKFNLKDEDEITSGPFRIVGNDDLSSLMIRCFFISHNEDYKWRQSFNIILPIFYYFMTSMTTRFAWFVFICYAGQFIVWIFYNSKRISPEAMFSLTCALAKSWCLYTLFGLTFFIRHTSRQITVLQYSVERECQGKHVSMFQIISLHFIFFLNI